MKHTRLALAAFLFAPLFARAAIADLEAIQPAGFNHVVVFTVAGYTNANGTARSEALENFPVLVRISEAGISGFDYDDMTSPATGDDLCFVGNDGTPLAFDIDTWNTNGTSLVWVTLPSMANGTWFVMAYGSSTSGKTVCADNAFAGYTGVWHMNETNNAVTTIYDATDNHLDGRTVSTSSSKADGKIGRARLITTNTTNVAGNPYDSGITVAITNNAEKLAAVDALVPEFTASFWIRPQSVAQWWYFISRRTADNEPGWALQNGSTLNNSKQANFKTFRAYGANENESKCLSLYNIEALETQTWVKIDAVWMEDKRFLLYVDGQKVSEGTLANVATNTDTPLDLSLGGALAPLSTANKNGRGVYGDMDEVRLHVGAMTADWIAADYATQTDESFLSASSAADDMSQDFSLSLWYDDDGVTPLSPASTVVSAGTSPVRANPAKHTFFHDFAFQGWTPVDGDGTIYTASGLPVQAAGTNVAYKAVWQTTLSDRVPDGFSRGVAFTVDGYGASRSMLTDFPVLVRISEYDANAGTGIQGFDYDDLMFSSTGDDICFVAEDGTPLAFEIDTWNTSSESLVWVKLPSMEHGTEFAMFYRSSKKGKVDICSANPFSSYVGVWHLREGGDGEQYVYDSTDNGLTARSAGLSLAVPTGMVGAARTVTTKREKADKGIKVQTTKGTELAALDTLGSDFVVSFWMRPLGEISTGDAGVRYDCLIGRKSQKTEKAWHVQLADHSTNLRVWAAENTDSGNTGPKTTNDILPLEQNKWTKLDVVYSHTNSANVAKYTLYANGAALVTAANLTAKALGGSSTLTIGGGFAGGERPFWGDMDEVRVGPFIPSADWVKADYDQVATTTFLTAGTVAEFAEAANPVGTFSLDDTGAAFAQFSGSISLCGGTATACDILVKAWPTANAEPDAWETLATGVAEGGTFAGPLVDLVPQTAYSYKIKAVNNLAEPLDSEITSGTFTTSGAGEVGTGGDAKRVGDSMVHTFTIARNGTDTYEFVPPSYATSVEALVVGGGGAGGYRRGGGGGAGGLIYNASLGVTGGATYTVTVGAGGDASASANAYGGDGGDSSIVGTGVSVTAAGGGAGGNGELSTLLDGRAGGSGGGSAHDGTAGAGTSGQGNAGGVGFNKENKEWFGGGGGGAMEAGASVTSGNTTSSGKGGDGRAYSISGVATFYAGGGGGGGTRSQKDSSYGSPGDGGGGGGGRGGQRMQDGAVDGDGFAYESARNGVDGTGGGGGGGGDTTGFYQGGDGGNGVVIVRYNVEGNGQGMTAPAIALESLSRDGTGVTTIGYRVAWAGDGYDYADVKVAWGFSKDDLPNTNAIVSSVIGRGTGTFTLPDQTKTVYVRAVAVNAGGNADQSPGFVTVPFVDPDAPEAEAPVVSSITSTGASFSAAVIGLGEGATSVQGVFQVCTEDDFEGTVLTFPAAQTLTSVPGSLTATATGLSVNTLYYVRASVTNDLPDVFETEPTHFRTGVPGAPSGDVVTNLTQVANPPAECEPPVATATTITAWGYLFNPGNNGASYANLRLEASTTANFQAVAAYTETESNVPQRGYRAFTLTDLEPETAYYLRLRMENDGRVVKYSDVVGPYTTVKERPPAGVMFLIY